MNSWSPRSATSGQYILENKLASLTRTDNGWHAVALGDEGKAVVHGETMLIAGLRAAVPADVGEFIDMPEWLA